MRFSVQAQHRDDWVHNAQNSPTKDFEGYDDNAARLNFSIGEQRISALFNVHARSQQAAQWLFRAQNIIKPGTNDFVDGFDITRVRSTGKTDRA